MGSREKTMKQVAIMAGSIFFGLCLFLSLGGIGTIDGVGSQRTGTTGNLFLDASQEHNLTANYQYMTNMSPTNVSADITATDSNLTFSISGCYFAWFSISGELGNNEAIEAALWLDETEVDNIEDQTGTPVVGMDRVSLSACGLIYISSGQKLTLRLKSLDAAADWDPDKISYGAFRIR